MATPVSDSLVGGVFQCFVAALYRYNGCAQHLHSFYIHVLTFYIECSLIHRARHVHQCASSCGSHTVLSCSSLSNDSCLAHLLRQKNLSQCIVNLVCACMVQVFTLQVEFATIFLAHALGKIEW